MKYAKPFGAALAVLALSIAAPRSEAALNAVDPGAYVAANGFFPAWYQDTNGRALKDCLSPAAGLNGPMCILLAVPGVFDPALPVTFPGNFPDESFFIVADALITGANGLKATYRAGLEAAFANGNVVNGDQITFARIRMRITLPTTAPTGAYTVTHPYGVEEFNVAATGPKAINLTHDVGVAPGIFTGALKGDIGPFLAAATGLITVGTETFIGDPNVTQAVTGSPFGTNFLRIEGPGGFSVETNLFTLAGQVSPVALPTPLVIDRTTYGRTATAFQTDVFAKAPPPALVSFTDPAPNTMSGDLAGQFFGQDALNAPTPLSLITVSADNSPNNAAVTGTSTLVDLVTISRAEYTLSTGTLLIEASSSDETGSPTLTAGSLGSLASTVAPLQSATFTGLIIPPAKVTVSSTQGGSDTEEVVILP